MFSNGLAQLGDGTTGGYRSTVKQVVKGAIGDKVIKIITAGCFHNLVLTEGMCFIGLLLFFLPKKKPNKNRQCGLWLG